MSHCALYNGTCSRSAVNNSGPNVDQQRRTTGDCNSDTQLGGRRAVLHTSVGRFTSNPCTPRYHAIAVKHRVQPQLGGLRPAVSGPTVNTNPTLPISVTDFELCPRLRKRLPAPHWAGIWRTDSKFPNIKLVHSRGSSKTASLTAARKGQAAHFAVSSPSVTLKSNREGEREKKTRLEAS